MCNSEALSLWAIIVSITEDDQHMGATIESMPRFPSKWVLYDQAVTPMRAEPAT